MKRIMNLGLTAMTLAAFVLASCTKDDDVVQKWQRKHLLSETCEYTTNDGVAHKDVTEHKYDERWNCIEKVYLRDGKDGDKEQYKYNSRGNIEEMTSLYNDTIIYVLKYEYDDSDNLLREFYFYRDEQSASGTAEYTHEGDSVEIVYQGGQLFKKTTTQLEGNIETVCSFYYSQGECHESVQSKTVYNDSNRDKILTSEKTYSSPNGKIKELYDAETEEMINFPFTIKSEYTYNETGNLVGFVSFRNGKLIEERKDYVYDGSTVTYTQYYYWNSSDTPSSIRYYTLVYAD